MRSFTVTLFKLLALHFVLITLQLPVRDAWAGPEDEARRRANQISSAEFEVRNALKQTEPMNVIQAIPIELRGRPEVIEAMLHLREAAITRQKSTLAYDLTIEINSRLIDAYRITQEAGGDSESRLLATWAGILRRLPVDQTQLEPQSTLLPKIPQFFGFTKFWGTLAKLYVGSNESRRRMDLLKVIIEKYQEVGAQQAFAAFEHRIQDGQQSIWVNRDPLTVPFLIMLGDLRSELNRGFEPLNVTLPNTQSFENLAALKAVDLPFISEETRADLMIRLSGLVWEAGLPESNVKLKDLITKLLPFFYPNGSADGAGLVFTLETRLRGFLEVGDNRRQILRLVSDAFRGHFKSSFDRVGIGALYLFRNLGQMPAEASEHFLTHEGQNRHRLFWAISRGLGQVGENLSSTELAAVQNQYFEILWVALEGWERPRPLVQAWIQQKIKEERKLEASRWNDKLQPLTFWSHLFERLAYQYNQHAKPKPKTTSIENALNLFGAKATCGWILGGRKY